MSLLVFQHHPDEHPALLGSTLRDHGHRLRVIRLDLGQPLPTDLDDVSGLVILGGPQNVDQSAEHPWLTHEIAFIQQARDANLPMVGICLGAQLIATALGGEVAPMAQPEVGLSVVRLTMPKFVDPVLQGIRWAFPAFHLHAQEVTKLPPGGMPLCMSAACKTQAYRVGMNIYAFQYHFEWDKAQLQAMAATPLATQAGLDAATLQAQLDAHYDEYRRLGRRLCDNIATLLLPVDRLATA